MIQYRGVLKYSGVVGTIKSKDWSTLVAQAYMEIVRGSFSENDKSDEPVGLCTASKKSMN